MTVEGAPVWNLATLMPDGAVGASVAGGRAVGLAASEDMASRVQIDRTPEQARYVAAAIPA